MPIIPRRDAYIWAKPIWQLNEADISVMPSGIEPEERGGLCRLLPDSRKPATIRNKRKP
jgi:hypothetical protein